MNFTEIWPQFNWIIDEMKDGMSLFDGYIPTIKQEDLFSPLSEISKRAKSHSLTTSIWADDASYADLKKEYSLSQYIELFHKKKIISLNFDYELEIDNMILLLRLIFEEDDNTTTLDIICYREPILESTDPKEAMRTAISEFRYLKKIFGGNSLFLGPDTSDYPKSEFEYSDEWLKIE